MSAEGKQQMSGPPARPEDLALAIQMAEETATIAMRWFSALDVEVHTKSDGSPVTNADIAIEQHLRRLIGTHDPEASIIGEEEGSTDNVSERHWYLDPIDGTQSFVHGVPLFGTLIALHDEHGPAVGVISLPAVGEIVAAGRGLGCTFNGKPARVSTHSELAGAFATTWGFESWPPELGERLRNAGAFLRGWGDAYGWALVATGRVEAVIDCGVKSWDVAPMPVIIAEAGGRYSTFQGDQSIHDGSGLGTNGLLHDSLLEIVKDLG